MARLSISVLGPLQITLDGHAVTGFAYDKVRALLAYLAVEADRPHRRDALVGLLWPDLPAGAARNNLRQALANLRQAIDDPTAQPPFLWITRETIQFNCASDHWLDVAAFADFLATCDHHLHRHAETCKLCAQRRAEAAALYRGDFLAGFFLPDSVAFDEWVLLKREWLHQCAIDTLARLAAYQERREDYEQARHYAMRELELDPLREEAHRQLMRVFALSGQRSAALAQYERCCRILADELGVEPEEETAALYAHIRATQPGSRETFAAAPPPSGSAAPQHNLPAQVPPFIGREHELAALANLLANPTCRLVTIVGPGGIGKTRLALEAATQQIEAFAHGVYFVSLTPLNSAEFLVPTIADALRFSFHGAEDPKVQLLSYLREKEVLLVLDNFEHLLAGVGLLVDILQDAPAVTILATSRERLNLRGEWVLEVAGLRVPEDEPIERIERYSAVQLFLQSAHRAVAGFAPSAEEALAVVRICRLVAGMPLGIELAAAWLRTLSCADIAHEIEQNLLFLPTALRDLPERHQSLRTVLDHSWKLLSEAERGVFRKLSVFRGSFERNAAQEVAGATLPILAALVDKSLLHRSGTDRYEMHELVRQYAQEQLREADELEQTRGRHLAFFLALTEAAEPHLRGAEQLVWLSRLEAEYDNLRAALVWSLEEANEAETGARLAGALWYFWFLHGSIGEARRWLEGKITRNPALTAVARAKDLIYAGAISQLAGPYPLSAEIAQEGLALARAVGEHWLIALALVTFAGKRQPDREEGLAIARQVGDPWLLALALKQMVFGIQEGDPWLTALSLSGPWSAHWLLGDVERAAAAAHEGQALARQTGDRWLIAWALLAQGVVTCYQGDIAVASKLYQEALALFRVLRARLGVANVLLGLANMATVQGDLATAHALQEERLAIERELDNDSGVAASLLSIGELMFIQSDYAHAAACFAESLTLFQSLEDKVGASWSYLYLGWVAQERGYYALATAQVEAGLTLVGQVKANRDLLMGAVLWLLGTIALAQGDHAQAAEHLEKSLALARERGNQFSIAKNLDRLGCLAAWRADYTGAHMLLQESLAIQQALGHQWEIANALGSLGWAMVAAGDTAGAAALLSQSLAGFQHIGARTGIAWTLEGLAAVAATTQPMHAARLLGAAEALRKAIGGPRWPATQPMYDRIVATARAHLDEVAFAATWAAGQALPVDEAIAEAQGSI